MGEIPKHRLEILPPDGIEKTFWDRVDKRADGHWDWTGKHATNGYGVFQRAGEVVYVHRHAYELVYGKTPLGSQIRIKCDRSFCVNPEHMKLFDAHDMRAFQFDDEAKKQFWSRVDKQENGCWIWKGVINKVRQYGQFRHVHDGRELMLHANRVAYELGKGPIPPGTRVSHTCGNSLCVNPDHLTITVTLRQKLKILEEEKSMSSATALKKPPKARPEIVLVKAPTPAPAPKAILPAHVRTALELVKAEIERHRADPAYVIPVEVLAMIDNALRKEEP